MFADKASTDAEFKLHSTEYFIVVLFSPLHFMDMGGKVGVYKADARFVDF